MKLRLVEAFAGIGSQVQALKNIGIDVETVGIFEIDKYAIKSYEAIHGEVTNFGDISKEVDIPPFDLFTYSFPCQDISNAGKKRGFKKGSGTRSSLLWECEKIIEKYRPPFLLMENVKALVSKKNLPNFEKWLTLLESYGYTNYWQVLNAKDYGVPQNRERVFCVSVLDGRGYNFPEPVPLEKHLVDIMESNVDDRFYLKQETIDKLVFKRKGRANETRRDEILQVGNRQPYVLIDASRGRPIGEKNEQHLEINSAGTTNTITTAQKDNLVIESKVLIKNGTKKGYLECEPGDGINTGFLESNTRRGRVQKQVSPTLTCNDTAATLTTDIRIRKLTPLECWRLMGFSDEAFHKAEAVNSNTQLYKQAGNSIVVDVLEAIFANLFLKEPEDTQISLF
ncbi:TPA: DNA cytosine methyltransferase [Enterococcus faecium]